MINELTLRMRRHQFAVGRPQMKNTINSILDVGNAIGSPVRDHGRRRVFDLARGLAVFFMVLIHVVEVYGRPEVQTGTMGKILLFLGQAPAAPVFMFLMGVGITFARTPKPTYFLKRGIEIFLLGYVLNFLRGSLPLWVALRLGHVTLEEAAPYTPLSELLVSDIFQFAGIALPLCGLVYCRRVHPYVILAVAVMIAFLSPVLWGFEFGVPGVDWVLSLLWGDGKDIYFPVFPWIAYPLFGVALGMFAQDRELAFGKIRHFLWWGVGLIILGLALRGAFPALGSERYARSGPGTILWMCGFVLVWLRMCAWLVQKMRPQALLDLLYLWSEHVTRFYFIHWVLVGWGIGLFGAESNNEPMLVVLMLGVLLLSDLLTRASLVWSSRPRRAAEHTTT